ncbi:MULTISPECIES: hypothetical protein [unclassified Sphingomonas]|uniref:hypothetical protein n=1 Tax=unclassified Sphingomonas TaxID=196159 RepID=UPI001D12D878|nr:MULTISPECIES: hypothetical protein [unclassified Sphingomonas]MCC2980446.1 hypothetical protein [Sphingomonas sp. IC4-52]MCD2316455.1 hypothetical protein [Sphingomonas sp. IC-11]
MTRFSLPILLLFLSGCATVATSAPEPAAPVPIPYGAAGLERVIGQDANGLVRLFGEPDADVREGNARKLQFQSRICVLDTYLYPKGSAEPRVTYVDARQPDGRAIDRASCVAALTRRVGGK